MLCVAILKKTGSETLQDASWAGRLGVCVIGVAGVADAEAEPAVDSGGITRTMGSIGCPVVASQDLF